MAEEHPLLIEARRRQQTATQPPPATNSTEHPLLTEARNRQQQQLQDVVPPSFEQAESWRPARQAGAGLYQTVFAPAARGDVAENSNWLFNYAMPGAATGLYSLLNTGVNAATGLNLPGGPQATAAFEDVTQDSYDALGTTAPRNAADMAANIVGGLAVPLPSNALAAGARGIGNTVRGSTALTGAGAQTAGRAGRIGEIAGRVGLEVALPFNNANTVAGYGATMAGMSTVGALGMDALMEGLDVPNSAYLSISDMMELEGRTFEDLTPAERNEYYVTMGLLPPEQAPDAQQISQELDAAEDDKLSNTLMTIAGVLGGAVVGTAIYSTARTINQARRTYRAAVGDDAAILTPFRSRDYLAYAFDRNGALRGVLNRAAEEGSIARSYADEVIEALDANNPGRVNMSLAEALNNGVMTVPWAKERLQFAISPKAWFETVARAGPDGRPLIDTVNEILVLRNELDKMRISLPAVRSTMQTRAANAASGASNANVPVRELQNAIKSPYVARLVDGLSPPEALLRVRQQLRTLEQNAPATQSANQYNDMMRKMLTYLRATGQMKRSRVDELLRTQPHYVMEVERTGNINSVMRDIVRFGDGDDTPINPVFSALETRDLATPNVAPIYNPSEVLPQYIANAIRHANHNRASFMTMTALSKVRVNGVPVVRKLGTGANSARPSANKGTGVTVLNNIGEEVVFEASDPLIATMLKQVPGVAGPMMGMLNSVRKLQQQLYTGFLNPFFVTTAASMEVLTVMVTRQKGVATGPLGNFILSTAAQAQKNNNPALARTLETLAKLPDPTTPIAAVIGAGRQLRGMLLNDLTRQAELGLNNIGLAQHFAPTQMRLIARAFGSTQANSIKHLADYVDEMHNLQASSTRSMLMRQGAVGSPTTSTFDALDGRVSFGDLELPVKTWSGNSGVKPLEMAVRRAPALMSALLDAVANGMRTEMAVYRGIRQIGDAQYAGKTLKRADMQKLRQIAKDTIEITGDFTRTPGAPIVRQLAQAIPYFNVTVQTMTRYLRGIKENPTNAALFYTSLGTVYGMVQAYNAEVGGPEALAYIMNELTPYQRARHIIIADPDNPRDPIMIPGGIDHILVVSPMIEAINAALGFTDGSYYSDPGQRQQMRNYMPDTIVPFDNAVGQAYTGAFAMAPNMIADIALLSKGYRRTPDGGLAEVNTNEHLPTREFADNDMEYLLHGTGFGSTLNSLFGTLGHVAFTFLDTLSQGYTGDSFMDQVVEAAKQAGTSALERERVFINNTSFGMDRREDSWAPYVNRYYDIKSQVDAVRQADTVIQSMAGTRMSDGGAPLPYNRAERFLNDPTQRQVLLSLRQMANTVSTTYDRRINELRSQLAFNKLDDRLNPEQRRDRHNELTRDLNDQIMQALDTWQSALRTVRQIDPSFDIDNWTAILQSSQ